MDDIKTILAIVASGITIVIGVITILSKLRKRMSRPKERGSVKAEAEKRGPEGENRSLALSPVDRGMEYFNRAVEGVIELVSSSQYVQATRVAKEVREEIVRICDQSRPDVRLLLGELEVWYAQALMYTGELQQALDLLEGIVRRFSDQENRYQDKVSFARWCNVLGRAHNHIGYINWRYLGHYEVALREFRTAIRILSRGTLRQELATSLDNLGRVYAHLGYRTRAELLIGHGLRLRSTDQTDQYRRALSLHSIAATFVNFGEPYRASLVIEDASKQFIETANQSGERGLGLALLTKGQSLRFLGSQGYPCPHSKKIEILKEAANALNEAEGIFRKVGEEIRLFQVSNELGCVLRERAALYKHDGDMENALRSTADARTRLEESIVLAKGDGRGYKHRVHYVDACEDLARLHFIMDDRREAEQWIKRGQEAILPEYRFGKKRQPSNILPADCYEDFWQQLGKINLLLGQMLFDEQAMAKDSTKKLLPVALQKAIGYFVLAAAYFGRFSERPLDIKNKDLYPCYRPQLTLHRLFVGEWYNRIQEFGIDDLMYIKSAILPGLVDSYGLEFSWLDDLVIDPVDCLLQNKPSGKGA